ncbi:MAG: antitoxin [Actinomycetota bacterium]|jgi:Arc/MetJ family transcription regulator|nr:antitoxin [Actinomycetota bacterium]
MRTTIDLPEDLHRVASAIARDQGTSLSEAVAMLLRRAIGIPGNAELVTSERTGLDVIRLGRTITSEDVRSLDDEP